MLRPRFASRDEYALHLGDVSFWWPYVDAALRRHGLAGSRARPGRIGTFPTFLVDGRHAVKLYGRLFGGGTDLAKELECYALVERDDAIAAPALVAHGRLFDDEGGWPWPYIITSALPGRPIAEVWGEMSIPDRLRLARWLGLVVRRLHELPLGRCRVLRPDWRPFAELLSETHRDALEGAASDPDAPGWLADQIEEYLGAPGTWFDSSASPVLVHADLHEDHVFVERRGERWEPTGIVDFGDAVAGDWAYELPALHFATFDGDKQLLRAFLESYGVDEIASRDLPRRALRFTILHRFISLRDQFRHSPQLRNLPDLEAVETALWDVNAE